MSYARVSTIQGSPDRVDEGIGKITDEVLPQLREVAGFQGIISLVDRDTGASRTITLWETEDAMRASEEAANRLREKAASDLGATGAPQVERYEVAIAEMAAPVTA
jgi:heme-degrading monooxygenase HmoA